MKIPISFFIFAFIAEQLTNKKHNEQTWALAECKMKTEIKIHTEFWLSKNVVSVLFFLLLLYFLYFCVLLHSVSSIGPHTQTENTDNNIMCITTYTILFRSLLTAPHTVTIVNRNKKKILCSAKTRRIHISRAQRYYQYSFSILKRNEKQGKNTDIRENENI